ncbi:MAG: putative dehydrogenase [Verrucomicrobiales bacterium]
MDIPQLNIGVIGATGYIGTPYRKEIRHCHNANIVALCARRQALLEAAGQEDGATCLTHDWREVVQHPEVNLVIVATPDALHHEAVLACAVAGKHVLCEKPVAINATQAREMLDAYQAKPELAHFVPFWVRYADGMVKAKEVYQAGTLGEIRGAVYRWHNPRPDGMPYTWRDDPNLSSAGSIADVGSHAYDTVRWILGCEAKRVLTHADTISPRADAGEVNLEEAIALGNSQSDSQAPARQGGTVDYASIAWEFTNGAVGSLILSHAPYFRKGLTPELELHGTKASLAVDRVSGDVTLVKPGGGPEVLAHLPDLRTANRFEDYVFPAIRSVIANNAINDHPNLDDGWRVQQFTDAAAASARAGGWAVLTSS